MIDLLKLREHAEQRKEQRYGTNSMNPEQMLELLDMLEAAQRDAERYKWLRDYHIGDCPDYLDLEYGKSPGLDSAIDAAMKAEND